MGMAYWPAEPQLDAVSAITEWWENASDERRAEGEEFLATNNTTNQIDKCFLEQASEAIFSFLLY